MNLFTGSRAYLSMNDHVTDLEIELSRTGEACEATGEHLEKCERCQERLAFLLEFASDQRLSVAPDEIPREVDNEIVAMAHRQSSRVRSRVRTRSRRRWVSAIAGAAAVFLLMVMSPPDPQIATTSSSSDINADGTVDILDALALARLSEESTDAVFDLNGDGLVDDRDVEFVVQEAVSLGEGSSG